MSTETPQEPLVSPGGPVEPDQPEPQPGPDTEEHDTLDEPDRQSTHQPGEMPPEEDIPR